MNNIILKYALLVAVAIAALYIFISILPFLLFLVAVGAIGFLIYGLVEVNSGRQTVDDLKRLVLTWVEKAKNYFSK